jgi:hypothetical protein
MTQPIPSETIEYERYVDGLRMNNAAMADALKVAIRHGKKHNEEYHHITSPEQLSDWEALIEDKASPKAITIHVEGGLVQDVTGIPVGYQVRVEDYDVHNPGDDLWDSEKQCVVTVYEGGAHG